MKAPIVSNSDFTDDFLVMALGQSKKNRNGLRKSLRDIDGTDADRGALVQSILIEEVAPLMRGMPPIIQQICGRVFMECVDWERLAATICTDPEEN
jgi:hypothetical protein